MVLNIIGSEFSLEIAQSFPCKKNNFKTRMWSSVPDTSLHCLPTVVSISLVAAILFASRLRRAFLLLLLGSKDLSLCLNRQMSFPSSPQYCAQLFVHVSPRPSWDLVRGKLRSVWNHCCGLVCGCCPVNWISLYEYSQTRVTSMFNFFSSNQFYLW